MAGPAAAGAVPPLWVIACPRCGDCTDAFVTIEAAVAFWNSQPETPSAHEGDEEPEPVAGLGKTGIAIPA